MAHQARDAGQRQHAQAQRERRERRGPRQKGKAALHLQHRDGERRAHIGDGRQMPDVSEAVAQAGEPHLPRLAGLGAQQRRHLRTHLEDEHHRHAGQQHRQKMAKKSEGALRQSQPARRIQQEIAIDARAGEAAQPQVKIGCGLVIHRHQPRGFLARGQQHPCHHNDDAHQHIGIDEKPHRQRQHPFQRRRRVKREGNACESGHGQQIEPRAQEEHGHAPRPGPAQHGLQPLGPGLVRRIAVAADVGLKRLARPAEEPLHQGLHHKGHQEDADHQSGADADGHQHRRLLQRRPCRKRALGQSLDGSGHRQQGSRSSGQRLRKLIREGIARRRCRLGCRGPARQHEGLELIDELGPLRLVLQARHESLHLGGVDRLRGRLLGLSLNPGLSLNLGLLRRLGAHAERQGEPRHQHKQQYYPS